MAEVLDYIEVRSPQGARHVKAKLYAVIELLAEHPKSGQTTNRHDIRRLAANPYPYVIFYRETETEIVIHGVRHTARRPI
jgi:toxin ParE1/3/4